MNPWIGRAPKRGGAAIHGRRGDHFCGKGHDYRRDSRCYKRDACATLRPAIAIRVRNPIIPVVNRRFHHPALQTGLLRLDPVQSRHLRGVLRIGVGETVELFDGTGASAMASVTRLADEVELQVAEVRPADEGALRLTIAAAPPKGSRADWLVEKLSELGVAGYIPLQTARTVVHPEDGKLQRWQRLATESAKQCKRPGLMEIAPSTGLQPLVSDARYAHATRWVLSTDAQSLPVLEALPGLASGEILALIGPEGGWTDHEEQFLRDSGFAPIHLTRTILRIETAAITLASLVMVAASRR